MARFTYNWIGLHITGSWCLWSCMASCNK